MNREEIIDGIIKEAAIRAKVLFDKFGFMWTTEETIRKYKPEYEVPSLKRIAEQIRAYVDTIMEQSTWSIEGGRIFVYGESESGSLKRVKIMFELGSIPMVNLDERGKYELEKMQDENTSILYRENEK